MTFSGKIKKEISMNMVANILGLGNAANIFQNYLE